MNLYIKNMVCHRCILAVTGILEQNGLHPVQVLLGEVILQEAVMDHNQLHALRQSLSEMGFELIDDQKSRLIERLKNSIIELVHYAEPVPVKYSAYLADKLQQDYTSLSKLFSELEGMTIEQYIIRQKTERVKELLVYDELSLSEIADQLGYSSVAHLSAQFKKITGLTPSFYKQKGMHHQRLPLDKLK
jgi:AraC family transcriptional regulator